jgi:hypothetical protein
MEVCGKALLITGRGQLSHRTKWDRRYWRLRESFWAILWVCSTSRQRVSVLEATLVDQGDLVQSHLGAAFQAIVLEKIEQGVVFDDYCTQ